MKKMNPVIDKLRFKVYYELPNQLTNYLYKLDNQLTFKAVKPLKESKYKKAYDVYFKSVAVGFMQVGSTLNPSYSQIVISNNILYTNQSLLKDLMNSFEKMKSTLDIDVSGLEVALDYQGKAFQNKIKRFIKKSKLTLKSKYEINAWTLLYAKNQRVKDKNDTLYIAKKNNRKTQYLRLENKSLEIKESSNKNYITDYHLQRGFDLNKTIYRFELIIPRSENLVSGNGVEYQSNKDENKVISKATLDNYIKRKNELEDSVMDELIFDFEYNKLTNLINEYIIKRNVKYRYDIKLTRLFEKEYLLTLFNTFSSKIIENSKELFPKNIYRTSKLITKKIEMMKKPRLISEKEQKEFNVIASLCEYLDKPFDDVANNLSDYINMNVGTNNNITDDIFNTIDL